MPRKKRQRQVEARPPYEMYTPAERIPSDADPVVLELDGYEALRLADYKGLSQEEVAEKLDVSRPTVTRILRAARKAIATALAEGRPLAIQGGSVRIGGGRGKRKRRRGRNRGRHGRGGPQKQ